MICLKLHVSIVKGLVCLCACACALAARKLWEEPLGLARAGMSEDDGGVSTMPEPAWGGRRRGRGSVPGARSRLRSRGALPTPGDADGVGPEERARLMEDLQQLKAMWSRVLDRIEEALTSRSSRAMPTGSRSQEEIMQLWGKVTWPLVFLTRFRTATVGDATSVALHDTEASMLKLSIGHATEAERVLEEELRLPIGLSDSYRLLESSIHASKKHSSPVPFDNACALLAAAVHDMQKATGIYFDGDNLLKSLTTLSVLAHFNVTRKTTAEDGDASHTPHTPHTPQDNLMTTQAAPVVPAATVAPVAPDNPFMPEVPNAKPKHDCVYMVHDLSTSTRFEQSDQPGDLVVVSLRPCTFAADFMQHICNESSTSLNATISESVVNMTRGIMFSDTGLGIACLATSVLPDLGIELDEVGSKALLSSHGVERFFEYAFADDAAAAGESASTATGGWADTTDACPWDASPDIEADLEW